MLSASKLELSARWAETFWPPLWRVADLLSGGAAPQLGFFELACEFEKVEYVDLTEPRNLRLGNN
jgi:hypothetical protein